MELEGIWRAAKKGDLAEVERLVGQDPGLLDAGDAYCRTPLVLASEQGHVGVVRWLLDKGAAINERACNGITALSVACLSDRPLVVRLLLERGADPTMTTVGDWTPLMGASERGHLEVVRVLLGHPSGKASINYRAIVGQTALWGACNMGRGGVVRALLESGADPTIVHSDGTTPTDVARQGPHRDDIPAEGRRECVAALEVSSYLHPTLQHLFC
jgi:uncharacterized protein